MGGWHAERTKTFIYSTFPTSAFSTWPLTSHSLTAQINIPTVYLIFSIYSRNIYFNTSKRYFSMPDDLI